MRFAIAGKRLLEVGYNGSVRLVEPHDYGMQKGVKLENAPQDRSE